MAMAFVEKGKSKKTEQSGERQNTQSSGQGEALAEQNEVKINIIDDEEEQDDEDFFLKNQATRVGKKLN